MVPVLLLGAGAQTALANAFAKQTPGISTIEPAPASPNLIAPPQVEIHRASAQLQPAPLPNPDIDVPRENAAIGPGLAPAFFREKTNFQGNGFAPGSNLDHVQNERRAPVPGLSWTVPVK